MNIYGFDMSSPVEEMLCQSLATDRFPHSVIIEGGSSEDRLELANKIAATLICSDDTQRPCGDCADCHKAALSLHPDIIIQSPRKEGSNKNESYAVDYVREIVSDSHILPNEAERKIYILQEAHLMNEQGQNAFLKTLEEPTRFSNFIILTPSKSVFLETILSRAPVFTLGGVARDAKDNVDMEKAMLAAKNVALATGSSNHFDLVCATGVFDKNQKLLSAALPIMAEIFASALRYRYLGEQENEYSDVASVLSKKLSKNALLKLIDNVNILMDSLDKNANLNLTLARLCTLFKGVEQE